MSAYKSKSNIQRDPNNGLQMALDDAIKFAATHRKGKDMTRDLSDVKQEKKLKRLKSELKKSKQQVVQNLVKCRAIDTAIKQSTLTNDAIKHHISVHPVEMTGLNGSAGDNTITSFRGFHGLSAPYLVERDLLAIESIPSLVDPDNTLPLPPSAAFTLQKALLSYDDGYLTDELEAFPACQVHAVNNLLFSKIAWVSSDKHISLSDAMDMYERADTMSRYQLEHLHLRGRITSDSDHGTGELVEIRWKILKNMLRKKLRLQYLAVQLSKCENDRNISLRSGTAKSIRSGSSSKRCGKITPKSSLQSQKMFSKSLDFNPKYAVLPELNVLSSQLERSQERQVSLNHKIISNISLVSRSVPLGSLQAASAYSKRVGGKKMYSALFLKAKGFWRLAFEKMKSNLKMFHYEIICQHFLKSYSAYRFFFAGVNAVQNKVRRSMNQWKAKLDNLRTLEKLAAILEIQRTIRGKMARLYVKNIHKHRAATKIQKYARGYVAHSLVRQLGKHKRLKDAVVFIENCWKKNVWRRALKNLFKLRKQTTAVSLIQRVYFGYQGRKIARAKRLVIAQHLGAVKMQCLWRRYRAIILVDVYYSKWRQVEGALLIQKMVRGIQGRLRAKIWKEQKIASERMQRGFRCYKARRERLFRHVTKASTHIQSIVRRKIARDRVTQMQKRRAQERKAHAKAFGVVEKMVLGHARRKKYVPRIDAHKKRRWEAAQALKQRMRAVWEGNKVRSDIDLQRRSVMLIINFLQQYLFNKHWRIECAILIQSVMRMHLAKRLFRERQEQYAADMNKQSFYYRLKKMHQRDQEAFFGVQALIIQSFWRNYYAEKVKTQMRVYLQRNASAEAIQRSGRNYILRRAAKEIANEKRKIKYRKEYAAVKIQKIQRGVVARKEYFKHQQGTIIKFFLQEAKSISLTRGLFLNFKKRKETLVKMNEAAVKIQAVARGVQGRAKVRKNYKRLVRNRDKNIKKRRERSAMKIQSIVRRKQAMKIVKIRQAEWDLKEKKRRQMEELDAKLEDLHENHINDLLVLRVQQGVRGNQARKNRVKQEEKNEFERKQQAEAAKLKAAAVLQGWARGMRGRKLCLELLPELRRQQRARAFCVECEMAPATRKCHVCKEQFCDVCFQNLHKKGTRKNHGFDYIRKGNDAVEVNDALGEKNPMMWEEQWDDSAQARYWYHALTGEATWINPFE